MLLLLEHRAHLLEDLGVLKVKRQLRSSEEAETEPVDEAQGSGLLEAEGEEGDENDEERLPCESKSGECIR